MHTFNQTFRFQASKAKKTEIARTIFTEFTGKDEEIISYARSPDNLNVDAKKKYAEAVGAAADKPAVSISVPDSLATEDLQKLLVRLGTDRTYALLAEARAAGSDYFAAVSYETVDDFFPEEETTDTVEALTEDEIKEVPRIVKGFIGANITNPPAAKFYLEILTGKRGEVGRIYIGGTPEAIEKRHNNANKAITIFVEKMRESTDKDIVLKLASQREKMVSSLYKKFMASIASNAEVESLDLGA